MRTVITGGAGFIGSHVAEAVVHAYADRVPATVVRLPSVYGPRERAVLKLFRMIQHGLVFGSIALKTRSVWYVTLIHWATAVSTDWSLLQP